VALTADRRQWVPRTVQAREQFAAWTGRIVTLAGLWSLVSIPLRPFQWPDWIDDAFGLFNIPAGSSIFLVISLLLLGSALRRRLRAALLLSVVWEALSAVLSAALFAVVAMHWNSLHTADPDTTRLNGIFALISVVTGVILALVLWSCRSAFPARLAAGSRLAALTVLVGGLLVSMSVAIMLTEFFPNSLEGAGERIGWSIRAAVGDPTAIPVNGHVGHHWVAAVAGVLSAASVLGAAGTFLRSARAKQYLGADEELHVRRLLLEAGEGDSLGYYATRRDKSVIFSPDGRAAVTYRVLASGEPGQRRPDRAPGRVAGGDRRVGDRGAFTRLAPGGAIGERVRRSCLRRGRPEGVESGRRGDHRRRQLHLGRPRDAAGAAGRHPHPARRVHRRRAPPRRDRPRRDRWARGPGREVARRGHRARLLDGPESAGRRRGRPLRDGHGAGPDWSRTRAALVSAMGCPRAVPRSDAPRPGRGERRH
jgi:hypothetical protein